MNERADGTSYTGNGRGKRTAKNDLLEVAVRLASDVSPHTPVRHHAVAHVSLSAVADTAGVTRSALYRIWPSQQDFWNDLVDVIVVDDVHEIGRDTRVVTEPAPDDEAGRGPDPAPSPSSSPEISPWGDAIRNGDLVDAAEDLMLLDRAPLLQTGIIGYPGTIRSSNPLSRRRATRLARVSRQIDVELEASNARCLAGLTPTDLAAAVVAISNGLPITGRLARHWELTLHHSAVMGAPASRRLLGTTLTAIRAVLTGPAWLGVSGPAPAPTAWTAAGAEYSPPPATERSYIASSGAGSQHDGTPPVATDNGTSRRSEYLQIGRALALHHHTAHDGLSQALGHVTLDSLARAAGVSRRTLSNIWPNQADFRLDLLSHLLARERRWVADAIADATAHCHTTGLQPFLEIGDALHRAIADNAERASFLAYAPLLTAPEIAERARRDHDALLDDTARQLVMLFDAVHRRPAPGVTLRQIALALLTLADGTNRLMRTSPDLIRVGIIHDDTKRTLTAFAAAAILTHLTEPLDSPVTASDLAALIS